MEREIIELMKPRFLVIADYPNSEYTVGEIVTPDSDLWIHSNMKLCYPSVEKFPQIFRKLEWWEERKVEEMPMYVRIPPNGNVIKCTAWYLNNMNWYGEVDGKRQRIFLDYFEPATEEEYNSNKQP